MVLEANHNIITSEVKAENIDEYSGERAIMIAKAMVDIHQNVSRKCITFVEQFGMTYQAEFSQQYIMKKGLKKFGERGKLAAKKELNQLISKAVFDQLMFQQRLRRRNKRLKEV